MLEATRVTENSSFSELPSLSYLFSNYVQIAKDILQKYVHLVGPLKIPILFYIIKEMKGKFYYFL